MARLPFTLLLAASLAPAQPAFERGQALLTAGRPADAETELALAVEQSPADAQAWRLLGLARISANRPSQAEPALLRACTLEQPPIDSCYYLGRNRQNLAQYEPARQAFDLALAASPSARVHRAAGLNYLALARYPDAEHHLRRAVALRASTDDDARVDLGAFLFRQGRLPEAARVLVQAAKPTTASPRAHLELGRVLLQQNKLEPAVHHLEEAVRRNPADANAHLLLARAYQRLGRDPDAARELRLGEFELRRKQP